MRSVTRIEHRGVQRRDGKLKILCIKNPLHFVTCTPEDEPALAP